MFFGGMPGGGFPGMPQKREPADTTKLYETLGVEKSSSAAQNTPSLDDVCKS